jgi:hypothetical protein
MSTTSTTSFMAVGVKCGVYPDGAVLDPSTVHVIDVNMGTVSTAVKTVTATPKISGNKVTGYNLTGTGAVVSEDSSGWGNLDWSKPTTSSPSGEAFAGWADAGAAFATVTTSGDLTVSIGTKSAVLPITPAV